ncbi:hypothetical protein BGZ60DRAFT_472896 [Tricladium varicosporioides]|nr:hypothetical protein BGZ60DRAFT_472896 [Hymenoscyphus varicosporioides]
MTRKWSYNWRGVARPSRFSGLRISPIRVIIMLAGISLLLLIRDQIPHITTLSQQQPAELAQLTVLNTTSVPFTAFQSPELIKYREPDTIDTFASYKFRNACNISSLDLHTPFRPLCPDRASILTAMASGGRIGLDAPYMPRGCDMRWFTSEEVCEILQRFDRIVLVGDSMLRHVIGSINILLRKDLGYGAVTDWNFSVEERKDCFCNEQFDVKACSVQGIYSTADVLKHDSESMSCHTGINVIMEEIVRFPIPPEELGRLKVAAGGRDSSKPKAFIFGHGLWSNLDLQKAIMWLETVVFVIHEVNKPTAWQSLLLTPNASGKEKPDEWIVTQGNKALMLFEEAMGIEARKKGIEHLGTWNMSIQGNKYDGVHLDMKGNLVKAMMVLNWLNML